MSDSKTQLSRDEGNPHIMVIIFRSFRLQTTQVEDNLRKHTCLKDLFVTEGNG